MKMDKPRTAVARRPLAELEQHRGFVDRHIGTTDAEQAEMLKVLGYASRSALIDAAVPPAIRLHEPLALSAAKAEEEALDELKTMARKNLVLKSYIGQGYYGTLTPGVILRNLLENPAWYTAYTPYQAEISQGRLEALLNFQTMVADLCSMDIANASMLDEATAALDSENGVAVMQLLSEIAKDASRAVLAVTHDPRTIPFANRVLRIEDGLIVGEERRAEGVETVHQLARNRKRKANA